MGTIIGLKRKIEAMDVDRIAVSAVSNTTEEMANIQAEQMMHGLDSKGQPIGQYRSPIYAEVKNRMNPLPGFGVPDLKLTGAFYRGIVAKVSGDVVVTDSTDSKSADLQKKYGADVFGLDTQYKGEYLREALQPEFSRQIESATGLKMN